MTHDDNQREAAGAWKVTRQGMVQVSATLGSGCVSGLAAPRQAGPAANYTQAPAASLRHDPAPTLMTLQLRVNGRPQAITVDTRITMLDALRENLLMKGSKKGCDHGQ